MNVLEDFIEQVTLLKKYTERKFKERKEEGVDVDNLLLKTIPGDSQSPLQIAIHAGDPLFQLASHILGEKRSLEVNQSLPPHEQVVQAYQKVIDTLELAGQKFSSLDDIYPSPFNGKEIPIRKQVRFLVFHMVEHGGQVIRFQQHLASCNAN